MKKLLWLLAGIVVAVAIAVLVPPVRNQLIALTLPDFPDWPAPTRTLSAEAEGPIYFESASPFDLAVIYDGMRHATPTTGLGYLSYPDSRAPSPAMILLPGSGGIAEGREHEYAEVLNAAGFAAFVVEYYAPRGVGDETNYLIRTASVTEFDLITDAYAALKLLSTSPRIDPQRIGVMGFSYGGMAARLAMDERIRQVLAPDLEGFAAHIDVYGPCFQNLQTEATNGAPLLTQRGTEDASNELAACAKREAELTQLGVEVEAVIYEGAGHAWENAEPATFREESPYVAGCEWTYDEEGFAAVNGEPLGRYPVDTSRAARIGARLSSGAQLGACVGYGYIVGRNEAVREQAYSDALSFLQRTIGQP